MSVARLIVATATRWQPTLGRDIEDALAAVLAGPTSRRWFNAVYRRLTFQQKGALHARFAGLFRDRHAPPISGCWLIDFVGRELRVPLRQADLWLDWDAALAVLGHEIAIKQTYAFLIESPHRPELFVDIGCNCGTHSLLFLAHQIDALSFEPNATCHEFFQALCAANGLEPRIEPVALGEGPGVVKLTYPPRETWLGTTERAVEEGLETGYRVASEHVTQRALDEYLPTFGDRRILIKIDTEGSELHVLAGAERTLQEKRPLIIFESWPGRRRRELYDFLHGARYQVASLPWLGPRPDRLLGLQEFMDSRSDDFIAVPEAEQKAQDARARRP